MTSQRRSRSLVTTSWRSSGDVLGVRESVGVLDVPAVSSWGQGPAGVQSGCDSEVQALRGRPHDGGLSSSGIWAYVLGAGADRSEAMKGSQGTSTGAVEARRRAEERSWAAKAGPVTVRTPQALSEPADSPTPCPP